YREFDNKDMANPDTLIDDQVWIGSASIMHMPTGLFVSGGYGNTDSENAARERSGWWVMAGIEKNWFGIGNTTLYGEYNQIQWDHNVVGVGQNMSVRHDGSFWGLGIVQAIDAAA